MDAGTGHDQPTLSSASLSGHVNLTRCVVCHAVQLDQMQAVVEKGRAMMGAVLLQQL